MNRSSKFIAAATVAGVSLLLSACGSDSGDTAAENGAGNTITIGVIAPMEGGFGEIGENILAGTKLAVKHAQEDGLAKGFDVEIKVKDSQASPEAAVQAARDFMSDDVQLLSGMLTTPVCSAVAPLVESAGGVLVSAVCAGNDLSGAYSGSAPFERTFTMAPRDSMVSNALAKVMAEKFPDVTNYNVFGYDYDWGHDTWEVYRDGMTELGVDIKTNQEFFVPLGETSFRTQVSALSRGIGEKDTSAAFLSTYGSGTTAFLQQAEAFSVTDDVKLMVGAGGYYPVARQLDGGAPDMWNAYDYSYAAYDNEMNTRFVEDFEAEHGMKPVSWTYEGYQAGMAYMAAIDKADSSEPDAIRDALEDVEFEGPAGEMIMNPETHQLMAPVVVSHTRGESSAPEGVEILETVVVPADELLGQG